MSNKTEKIYAPYEGSEPYLFLRFSNKDTDRAESVLKYLYEHKCRVWYFTDNARSMAESELRQKRMNGANLTVLLLTDNATNDSQLKSDILYSVAQGKKYLVLRLDEVSNLSMGLSENAPSINSTEEILRADGFSMELLDENVTVNRPKKKSGLVPACIALILIALAVFAFGFIFRRNRIQKPEEVKTLYLDVLPDNPGELDKYPNLEKIVIPQSEAGKAEEFMDRYEIVLTK